MLCFLITKAAKIPSIETFTMGLLSTGLSSILPLGHGHSRPSVEEVFTKVSRQMSLEHQPPVEVGKGFMGSDPKTHKKIKKHLCRSIYKASKNRMYMS